MSHRNHLMLIEFHLRFNLIFPLFIVSAIPMISLPDNHYYFIALSVPTSGPIEIGFILTRWKIIIFQLTSHKCLNLPQCVKKLSKFGYV